MESRVIRLAYSTLYHSIQLVFTFYIFYHTSHTDSDIIGAVSEAPKGGGGLDFADAAPKLLYYAMPRQLCSSCDHEGQPCNL